MGVEFLAVSAVRDDQNNFAPLFRGAIFEQLRAAPNGVVQGFVGLCLDGAGRGIVERIGAGSGLAVDGGTAAEWVTRRGGGSARVQLGTAQLGNQFFLILGEAGTFVEELVEAADAGFVVDAEAADDGAEAGFNLVGIFLLQIVIDKYDHRKRNGLGGKRNDVNLFHAILKNAKFIFLQVGHQIASLVFDGDRDDDVGGGDGDGFLRGRRRRLLLG